jgi:hypothetical protein
LTAIGARCRFGIGQDLAAHRRDATGKVGRQGRVVDHLEFELGGLAEQRLERLRVLKTGHLHDDAGGALTQDGRLLGAQPVDTLAHDLDGGIHRLAHRLVDAFLGRGQHEAVAVDDLDVPVALAGQPRARGERQDRLAHGIDLGGIVDQEGQAAIAVGNVADADRGIGLPQLVANRFVHAVQPLLAHLRGIGLKLDVAATGKVEPQVDFGRRQRGRPGKA